MIVIPAIDIKGGNCVRLLKGDFSKETVYSDNPLEVASMWFEGGAECIHLVDLDGAKTGLPNVQAKCIRPQSCVIIYLDNKIFFDN